MSTLNCSIKYQSSIGKLISLRSAFGGLRGRKPIRHLSQRWSKNGDYNYDTQVIFIGKTGYGKSTALNSILRKNIFESSDIYGCTREMQSAEFEFPGTNGKSCFSIADLPGLGESPEHDTEYFELYRKAVNNAHIAVYFLRADQRDYSVDLKVFSELFNTAQTQSNVLIALNAVDKVEPLDRNRYFYLTDTQNRNLEVKKTDIASKFGVKYSSIFNISSVEDYGLDVLVEAICKSSYPYME